MGLGAFVKGQFIDLIEFVDNNPKKLLVYKYTRDGDEVKQGAQLIVRNGQIAVFVHRGQIADIFSPGNYKLDTGNLPILSSLSAVPYLLRSPIKSDLYFINTTQFINNKWGTKQPIIKRDPDMGMVRFTAFGNYAFRIADPKTFLEEVFGARSLNVTYDIIEYLNAFVSEAIAKCLGEIHASTLDLATHYSELSDTLTGYLNNRAMELGIAIPQAIIENIGLPAEVEKLIDEQSGIGLASRNMDNFIQYQSARAIRDAAKQKGGLAGIGAGMAVGRTVASTIDTNLSKSTKSTQESSEETIEKLLKYKQLLDQGILTQEEFEELKTKLIKDL